MSSSPVATPIIYLGLDVHTNSVTIAVLPADATAPTRIDTYPNNFAKLTTTLWVTPRRASNGRWVSSYSDCSLSTLHEIRRLVAA